MKTIIVFSILFLYSYCFAQDSLFLTQCPLINKEIRICKTRPDQKAYFDSLLHVYELDLIGLPTGLNQKNYTKLVLFHFQAASITYARKQYKESMSYFEKMKRYADSLAPLAKKDEELGTILSMINVVHIQFCSEVFQKDKELFFSCNCKSLFREFDEVDSIVAVTAEPVLKPLKKENLNYGEFYSGDTLRLNKKYISNHESVDYFRKNQLLILEQLRKFNLSEVFEKTGQEQDTIIIHFQIVRSKTEIVKRCSIVESSCPETIRQSLLEFVSTMPLPYIPAKGFDFYLPIVLKHETNDNKNKVYQSFIANDHFLLEYETAGPIKLN